MTTQVDTHESKQPARFSLLDRLKQIRWGETLIETLIRIAGVSTIFIVVMIFFFLLREGMPAFLDIPLRQLFSNRWYLSLACCRCCLARCW